MTKTATLMKQDGNSPVLFWTTKLQCTRHDEGSVSLRVVENSAFGRITRTVATRSSSAAELVHAMMSISDWSDLQIDCGGIVDTICPRLAGLDGGMAEAIAHEAAAILDGAHRHRKAA